MRISDRYLFHTPSIPVNLFGPFFFFFDRYTIRESAYFHGIMIGANPLLYSSRSYVDLPVLENL